MATEPITLGDLLTLMVFVGTLWALFTVYQRVITELRETRILLNILCKHAGIDPEEILGGREQ